MRCFIAVVVLIGLSLWPPPAEAQCVNSIRSDNQTSVNYIRVRYRNTVPQWAKEEIRVGMAQWNSTLCNLPGSYGDGLDFREFPVFTETLGSQYDGLLYIDFVDGFNAENSRRCAVLEGLEITFFSQAIIDGAAINCHGPGMLQDTAAHEFGHRLGLGHSPCPGYIMSQATIGPGGYIDRSVQSSECSMVVISHLTPDDAMAEDGYCQQHDSSCHDGDYEYCSPIVIPLDSSTEITFSSPEEGVWFDLDGDGPDRVGWTRKGENLALLWRDLNGNRKVDSGRELFGSVTPLISGGEAFMGYEALAEFDAPEYGGNGNGWADVNDYHWKELLLWIDWNHDGMSQRREIRTPRQVGLYAIQILATHSRTKDAFGNWPRWWAPAYIQKKGRRIVVDTTDVFFVHLVEP